MKWLLLAVMLSGCTQIYITGDNNMATIGKETDVSTDAKLDGLPLK